jgi:hypothetical protein
LQRLFLPSPYESDGSVCRIVYSMSQRRGVCVYCACADHEDSERTKSHKPRVIILLACGTNLPLQTRNLTSFHGVKLRCSVISGVCITDDVYGASCPIAVYLIQNDICL